MKRILCLAVLASLLAGPVLAENKNHPKSPPSGGRDSGGHQHGNGH